jgi:hypothetical protein
MGEFLRFMSANEIALRDSEAELEGVWGSVLSLVDQVRRILQDPALCPVDEMWIYF